MKVNVNPLLVVGAVIAEIVLAGVLNMTTKKYIEEEVERAGEVACERALLRILAKRGLVQR